MLDYVYVRVVNHREKTDPQIPEKPTGYGPHDLSSIVRFIAALVTSYDNIYLCQYRLKQWLGAWRHQAITCANVDLSLVRSSDIHLMAI